MGGETFDLVAFSAAARDRQDAGCAEACALPVSSMISLDMEVSEETVAGICLRTLENKLPVRELRVKKVRARSTDYGAIIEILKRSPALEVRGRRAESLRPSPLKECVSFCTSFPAHDAARAQYWQPGVLFCTIAVNYACTGARCVQRAVTTSTVGARLTVRSTLPSHSPPRCSSCRT